MQTYGAVGKKMHTTSGRKVRTELVVTSVKLLAACYIGHVSLREANVIGVEKGSREST